MESPVHLEVFGSTSTPIKVYNDLIYESRLFSLISQAHYELLTFKDILYLNTKRQHNGYFIDKIIENYFRLQPVFQALNFWRLLDNQLLCPWAHSHRRWFIEFTSERQITLNTRFKTAQQNILDFENEMHLQLTKKYHFASVLTTIVLDCIRYQSEGRKEWDKERQRYKITHWPNSELDLPTIEPHVG